MDGIPCWSSTLIRINPETEQITIKESPAVTGGRWQWHGGCLGSDGRIYGVPSNADRVLRIDPETLTGTLIGPEFSGQNKWYGGIEGANGCIYCIPYTAQNVLMINPKTGYVDTIGESFPISEWKWHGGVRSPDGRYIIGIPSHSTQVLKIDTLTSKVTLIGPKFPGRYKWGGACVGRDGLVYGIPSDYDRVLVVNPEIEEVKVMEIEGGSTLIGRKNLWQGAVLADNGAIYAIPCDATSVLKIDPDSQVIKILGELPEGGDKWQGGILGQDGGIYGIPQNSENILRVDPQTDTIDLLH
ncbi:hypothetical protein AAMO2058_000054500 [Amorphochlora amoebiformis]